MKSSAFFVSGLLSLNIFCFMFMSLMYSDINMTLNLFLKQYLFIRQSVYYEKYGKPFQKCDTTVITAYFQSNLSKHTHDDYNGWMKNMLCNKAHSKGFCNIILLQNISAFHECMVIFTNVPDRIKQHRDYTLGTVVMSMDFNNTKVYNMLTEEQWSR